jgi:NTP pyrophosphatase (non-canonical NTP hydrolase)
MSTIHNRILNIQKQLQLSTSEIAGKLGLSEENFLISIECPSDLLIRQICTLFGVNHQYLTEGVNPMVSECTLPVYDILAFRDARDWKQFHTPKDLAISLSLEAAELLECFQWSGCDVKMKNKQVQMEDELADILIYSVLFADAINADIPSIIKNKLKKNSERYAVSKAYGNAKKYTEFSDTE